MRLLDWINKNQIELPIRLELELDDVVVSKTTGNEVKYFHVEINGQDVSELVAEFADLKLTNKKGKTNVEITGSYTDLAFALQDRLYRKACSLGRKDVFSGYSYIDKGLLI